VSESSNQHIAAIILNGLLIANVISCFVRAIQFSFGLLCMALFVPKNECYALISKRKQHTFGTFGHIKLVTGQTISSFSSVRNASSKLNLSNRSNTKKTKLKTMKSKFIITKQEVISMVQFIKYPHLNFL